MNQYAASSDSEEEKEEEACLQGHASGTGYVQLDAGDETENENEPRAAAGKLDELMAEQTLRVPRVEQPPREGEPQQPVEQRGRPWVITVMKPRLKSGGSEAAARSRLQPLEPAVAARVAQAMSSVPLPSPAWAVARQSEIDVLLVSTVTRLRAPASSDV